MKYTPDIKFERCMQYCKPEKKQSFLEKLAGATN